MKLVVEYKYDGKKFFEIFEGNNGFELLESARKSKHYEKAEEIMYDYLDGVETEDGNKQGER